MKSKHIKKWLTAGVALLLCLCTVGCNGSGSPSVTDPATDSPLPPVTEPQTLPETDAPEVGIVPTWSDKSMNGLCIGLTGARSRGLPIDNMIDLMGVMNVKAMRNWMHLTSNLDDPNTAKDSPVKRQKGWIEKLRATGINKIIGMSHYWFWPESVDLSAYQNDTTKKNLARSAAPYRDMEDPLYLEWLELYEQSWYTMAKTYPEIEFWEVGNEVNMDLYLHPLSYIDRGIKFTMEEKAEIVTDMVYHASRGIHRANPEAIVIFPGLAPVNGFDSMVNFLEQVYENIESGEFGGGTTDTNCYFQAVAWHGYVLQGEFSTDAWIADNHRMYQVMKDHGDGDKKVFLTEFGFSDGGSRETDLKQAGYYEEIYNRLDEMPYLDSIYPFRMAEDTNNADKTEVYYGIFRVFEEKYFGAKEKAKVLCRLYGGDASQLDRYIGGHKVYS